MEKIRGALIDQLQNHTAFHLFGVPVPESVAVTWLIMAALALAAWFFTRRLRVDHPGRAQLVLEMFVGLINNFTKEATGEHWRAFAPYLGTVALYIGCANLIGIFGLVPPTKDLNVTIGLALMSVGLIYGASVYYKGARGGFRKFAEPMALLVPINLMEIVIRPLSLCMRLFGNVLGSFVIMELIKCVAPVLAPLPFSLYFDVFDGIIQTIVFVFLTALFLGEAVE